MSKTSKTFLPAQLAGIGETTTMAIMYLRVSTKEQAERGGRAEGFSIPAQREANLKKASDLGAIVVEEFVEAGESAKTADRPALQAMLEYVKTRRVQYCIIHKLDRLARNRADDVQIHLALQKAGVMLVSATESIDETPSGILVHGIMATIAEFYSQNLAAEVSKGMAQKAASGGTNGRAPIGYINIRRRDELGRDVALVEIDPERGPLITWAFQAYATGNYSTSQLHEELVDRGLTCLPTPKRPARPIGLTTIQTMLSNPYYKGDIIFRDTTYDGLHPRLVQPEIWYRVQTMLRSHNLAKDRTQQHSHYLKGTLYCKNCDSRLLVTNAKSHTGTIYPYFICAGRHSKRTTCTRRAVPVDQVAEKIEAYYRTITIPEHIVTALRKLLTAEFDHLYTKARDTHQTHQREKTALLAKRKQLLDAHYAGAIPIDLLKQEQDHIARRLAWLNTQIEAGKEIYENAKAHLKDVLNLAGNAYELYMSLDDNLRRICNQAFFEKIYISDVDTITAQPHQGFATVLNHGIQHAALAANRSGDANNLAAFNNTVQGLNVPGWVELAGLEPATCSLRTNRATTCAIAPCR